MIERPTVDVAVELDDDRESWVYGQGETVEAAMASLQRDAVDTIIGCEIEPGVCEVTVYRGAEWVDVPNKPWDVEMRNFQEFRRFQARFDESGVELLPDDGFGRAGWSATIHLSGVETVTGCAESALLATRRAFEAVRERLVDGRALTEFEFAFDLKTAAGDYEFHGAVRLMPDGWFAPSVTPALLDVGRTEVSGG